VKSEGEEKVRRYVPRWVGERIRLNVLRGGSPSTYP
jgi:hypothetical protein